MYNGIPIANYSFCWNILLISDFLNLFPHAPSLNILSFTRVSRMVNLVSRRGNVNEGYSSALA